PARQGPADGQPDPAGARARSRRGARHTAGRADRRRREHLDGLRRAQRRARADRRLTLPDGPSGDRRTEMSTLNTIRLVALDSDGVLLNDTYSPVIERFVTKHGGEYTAAVERGVWGSPQLAAGQNMALACRLPWSEKETIVAFFAERDEYLKEHPVEVMPGAAELLATLREVGVRVTCYGGRNREYTFDRYLGHLAGFFDAEIPYVDVN